MQLSATCNKSWCWMIKYFFNMFGFAIQTFLLTIFWSFKLVSQKHREYLTETMQINLIFSHEIQSSSMYQQIVMQTALSVLSIFKGAFYILDSLLQIQTFQSIEQHSIAWTRLSSCGTELWYFPRSGTLKFNWWQASITLQGPKKENNISKWRIGIFFSKILENFNAERTFVNNHFKS